MEEESIFGNNNNCGNSWWKLLFFQRQVGDKKMIFDEIEYSEGSFSLLLGKEQRTAAGL